jgi:hypothetical protein
MLLARSRGHLHPVLRRRLGGDAAGQEGDALDAQPEQGRDPSPFQISASRSCCSRGVDRRNGSGARPSWTGIDRVARLSQLVTVLRTTRDSEYFAAPAGDVARADHELGLLVHRLAPEGDDGRHAKIGAGSASTVSSPPRQFCPGVCRRGRPNFPSTRARSATSIIGRVACANGAPQMTSVLA